MTREKEIQKEQHLTGKEEKRTLILMNDEVHTFDYVIRALVDVCGHTSEQAEQCAFITHFKGKCDVASGPYDKLATQKKALSDRKLHVIID
ncbi:MAG: ATP-dependent Clp protease adaptor ClpS [Chlorobi bacterium]|nr:ATP-dependent Clp protease adaptor ClpS [Chlorobiota bacterium]